MHLNMEEIILSSQYFWTMFSSYGSLPWMGFWLVVRDRHCYYFFFFIVSYFTASWQKLNLRSETLFFTVAIHIPQTSQDRNDSTNCSLIIPEGFHWAHRKCSRSEGLLKGMGFLCKVEGGLCGRWLWGRCSCSGAEILLFTPTPSSVALRWFHVLILHTALKKASFT